MRQVESGNSNGVGSEKGKNEANEAGMVRIRLNGGSNMPGSVRIKFRSYFYARIQQNGRVRQLLVSFLISTNKFYIQRLEGKRLSPPLSPRNYLRALLWNNSH